MQYLIKSPTRHLASSREFLSLARKRALLASGSIDSLSNCNPWSLQTALYHDIKYMRKEYNAACALLRRSGFRTVDDLAKLLRIERTFGTSSRSCSNKTPSGGPAKEPSSNNSDDDPNKKKNNKTSSILYKYFIWMIMFWFLITLIPNLGIETTIGENVRVTWNDFLNHMLSKGEVKELIIQPHLDIVTIVLHPGAIVKGQKRDWDFHYLMTIGDAERFEEKLRSAEDRLNIRPEDRVPITWDRGYMTGSQIATILFAVAMFAIFLSRMRWMKSPISFEGFRQMTRAKFTLVDPLTGSGKGVRFSDVAGLKEAKIEVMEFVDYLKNPEHYKKLGAKVPKGAILLGPPGCGKTLLAKAVATESNVPFLSMNGSEFIEMIGGLGAARVRDLFKEGKARSPCIIYIDEIDAIGKKRSSGAGDGGASSNSESDQTLNQLLVEMDGMASKEGVILLASTNRADVLDKALLRPGRFDRHILIDLPTVQERREIFEHHLQGITLEQEPKSYSPRMAYLTPGFSGADIANVCNEAALHAARFKKKIVGTLDLEYAVERMVGGTEKRQHAMSPTEKRVVAYHEAGHALVGWMLEHTDALLKVTIVPRTNLALGFAQYTPTEQKLYTKEQLFERMCMVLGGRVAESLTFNRITTGAQNDLEKITKLAYAQIRQFGMNDKVGLLSFDQEETSQQTKKPYSKSLAHVMDVEARRLINDVYKRTAEVLSTNRDKLELLAETLLKKETLNYNDVVELIGPPPFGNKHMIEPAEFEASIKNLSDSEAAPSSSSAPTEPEKS